MKISSKKERDEFFKYITEKLPQDPILIKLNMLVIAYLCAGIMIESEQEFKELAGRSWRNAVKLLEKQVDNDLSDMDIDDEGDLN